MPQLHHCWVLQVEADNFEYLLCASAIASISSQLCADFNFIVTCISHRDDFLRGGDHLSIFLKQIEDFISMFF